MCFRDLLDLLSKRGVKATAAQVRWAINTGKIPRPRLDGSLRYAFTQQEAALLVAHFRARETKRR